MMHKLFLAGMVLSSSLFADTRPIQGSDTMAELMRDAIQASRLESSLIYQGGGSGKGEEALVSKKQGIAPMSRALSENAKVKAQAAGIGLIEHIIGLDGVAVFVNAENETSSLTLQQIEKIFTCKVTNWKDVGGQDLDIVAYRRNDFSGTTDTFKSLVGIKEFGTCVKIVEKTEDIGLHTATEEGAVGYAGLSAARDGNKDLAIAKDEGSKAFLLTQANIQNASYPLARNLYVYEGTGSLEPTASEKELLDNLLDRAFADPLLLKHEFFPLD